MSAAELTQAETDEWIARLRRFSGRAEYDKAHALTKKLMKQYPEVFFFRYYEAVMSAEKVVGFTEAQLNLRYKKAARKLKPLLFKLRGQPHRMRDRVRNEYYWFSKQHYKQFQLGIEIVGKGRLGSYYCQGVGATMLARRHVKKSEMSKCLFWSKRAEKAWLNYFKVQPDWSNSYFFYAMVLGYQNRIVEMDKAFARSAKLAGKTSKWKTVVEYRKEVMAEIKTLRS